MERGDRLVSHVTIGVTTGHPPPKLELVEKIQMKPFFGQFIKTETFQGDGSISTKFLRKPDCGSCQFRGSLPAAELGLPEVSLQVRDPRDTRVQSSWAPSPFAQNFENMGFISNRKKPEF